MSFALEEMRDLVREGAVARVVVAETAGSVPREVGAAMVVTGSGIRGTIGGGALEYEAIARARTCLRKGTDTLLRVPLGPGLGQCCGGAVTLLTEVWTDERLAGIAGEVVARPVPDNVTGPVPMPVRRILAAARNGRSAPEPALVADWFIEPVSVPVHPIWIYGAGHVGRAVAAVLAPLPGFSVTLVDDASARFPDPVPAGVAPLVAANPADAVRHAPCDATHLVLTYSHALDLEICHQVLSRDFRALGLIGSATKRARFRSRLAALGHGPAQIDRMACPIGDPALGKHPQAIAVGVAARLIPTKSAAHRGERRA